MPMRDMLGNRMKEYEQRNQYWLQKRTPVCIRVDMRAGHTFTKGFKRPFDEIFMKTMQQTAQYMCENIEGAVLSYQQSDEITIILQDYKKLNTEAWFDYRTDKLCSVSASMATMAFNKYLREFTEKYLRSDAWVNHYWEENVEKYANTLNNAINKGAMFDSRCFNIPIEEVTNCLIWRQQDATRNAIQMLGQCNFSHNELQGKSCDEIQDMLMTQKNINFNDMPTEFKRGVCCVKNRTICEPYGNRMLVKDVAEGNWVIDKEIPIFTQDRNYINDCFNMEEE